MATEPRPDHIAHELLSRAHSPTQAQTIFTDKVVHKPLNLRPTSPDPNSQDARAKRRRLRLRKKEHLRRRLKPKPLSAKEKRVIGIYDIRKEDQKYAIYVPLHRMWIGYMWEILGLKDGEPAYLTAESVGPKLASADYHGAELEVVRSRCVGRVGCKGIVVKDTKFTFEMITKKNVLRTVPKRYSIFRFEIPQPTLTGRTANEVEQGVEMVAAIVAAAGNTEDAAKAFVFELHGSQFESRATDRATKKFKQRRVDDL